LIVFNVGPDLGRHLRGMGDTEIGAAPSGESGPDCIIDTTSTALIFG